MNGDRLPSKPGTVLVGWNGSDEGQDALQLAVELMTLFQLRLAVACVIDPGRTPPELSRHRDTWVARLEALFDSARHELGDVDFSIREAIEDPVAGLRELALEEDAEFVVLGSTHHGAWGRLVPGAVAERLFEDPPCAIAVAPRDYGRTGPHLGYGIVGIGYDGTRSSRAALSVAARAAEAGGGEVRIVSIAPDYVAGDFPLGAFEPVREEAKLRLKRALESLDDEIPRSGALVTGDPAAVLEAQAVELDLLVIGSRGRGPIKNRMFGSVSADVIRKAPCPVIVVPVDHTGQLRNRAGA